ncbi:hypothetical protein B0H10DRAFT_1958256 [Mycena sp. CBHHK59/15]|nr:hypothetical protein B0H10DRAFT_1958256 [Mycena sp. CBHHK59/15]
MDSSISRLSASLMPLNYQTELFTEFQLGVTNRFRLLTQESRMAILQLHFGPHHTVKLLELNWMVWYTVQGADDLFFPFWLIVLRNRVFRPQFGSDYLETWPIRFGFKIRSAWSPQNFSGVLHMEYSDSPNSMKFQCIVDYSQQHISKKYSTHKPAVSRISAHLGIYPATRTYPEIFFLDLHTPNPPGMTD